MSLRHHRSRPPAGSARRFFGVAAGALLFFSSCAQGPSADPPPPVVVPVAGDGRLVDVPDVNRGRGWDTCPADLPLTDSPVGDATLPAARRGQRYLISTAPPATRPLPQPGVPSMPQAYWFLDQPGSAAGLWIDLVAIGGSVAHARLSAYETDAICVVQRALASVDLDRGLEVPGQWGTACLDLTGAGLFKFIGIRIDSDTGRVGVDAVRFGPPCPGR